MNRIIVLISLIIAMFPLSISAGVDVGIKEHKWLRPSPYVSGSAHNH
ncbi:hypothetical protein K8T06_14195 [bacterium]|nr:hypothetical protein [bacterium]